jgi:hypothetical protein
MCGLIALCGPVPPGMVHLAVVGAGRRGPHSSGLALWQRGNLVPWQVTRTSGRLDRWTLAPRIGTVIVGHSRLATATANPGDMPDPAEGQPLEHGSFLIAHNGTLTSDEVDRAMDMAGESAGYDGPVDSGAILAVLAAGGPAIAVLANTDAPQAALWSDGEYLIGGRFDGIDAEAHPLYATEGTDPVSERPWLAVSSGPLPDNSLPRGGTLLSPNHPHQLWRLP